MKYNIIILLLLAGVVMLLCTGRNLPGLTGTETGAKDTAYKREEAGQLCIKGAVSLPVTKNSKRDGFLQQRLLHHLKYKLKKSPFPGKAQTSNGAVTPTPGITGILMAFIPALMPVLILCLAGAIVFGRKIKAKFPGDKEANAAIIIGWTGIVVLAIALLLNLTGSINCWKFELETSQG